MACGPTALSKGYVLWPFFILFTTFSKQMHQLQKSSIKEKHSTPQSMLYAKTEVNSDNLIQ